MNAWLDQKQQDRAPIEAAARAEIDFKASLQLQLVQAIEAQNTLLGQLATQTERLVRALDIRPTGRIFEIPTGETQNVRYLLDPTSGWQLDAITTWTRTGATGTINAVISNLLPAEIVLATAAGSLVTNLFGWPVLPEGRLRVAVSGGTGVLCLLLRFTRHSGG
jgi:hypothetical protein